MAPRVFYDRTPTKIPRHIFFPPIYENYVSLYPARKENALVSVPREGAGCTSNGLVHARNEKHLLPFDRNASLLIRA